MRIIYKHLTQKSSFCGPTSLQMVLFRRGIWVEQEELARLLGIKIREKNKDRYLYKFEINEDDAGISLEDFSKVEDFLKEKELKSEIIKFKEIKDVEHFKKLIEENLEKGNDLIVNFKRTAYNLEKDWGHFALISAIENDEIEICDPSYEEKSYWKTSVDKLLDAISDKYDRKERGVVMLGPC